VSFLEESPVFITEGSVYERLRRHEGLAFDPLIAHASLVYDELSREALETVHREYLEIASRTGWPMLALTDTWRANHARLALSRISDRAVNADNVRFMRSILADTNVLLGGNVGPVGDAYRPEEAPGREAAARHHAPQIEELATEGVDFLQASTLPSLEEAFGIAEVMSTTGLPYLLSFVVRPAGTLLDGTPLAKVVQHLDDSVATPPVGYLVNCVHPDRILETRLPGRFIGLQANASKLTPEELDGREELDAEPPELFAEAMVRLHARRSLKILGGCCGTGAEHIEALANALGCP
jgi:homocysteine S-methyltransferase